MTGLPGSQMLIHALVTWRGCSPASRVKYGMAPAAVAGA